MNTLLHVGNLAADTTTAEIAAVFRRDDRNVVKVDLVIDRNRRSRGFAFVHMAAEADARHALQSLDGSTLGGRTIRVAEANAKRSRFGGSTRTALATLRPLGHAQPPPTGDR